jgi:hypothetical protein
MVIKRLMNSIFKRKKLDTKQADINDRLKYAVLQNLEHPLEIKPALTVK